MDYSLLSYRTQYVHTQKLRFGYELLVELGRESSKPGHFLVKTIDENMLKIFYGIPLMPGRQVSLKWGALITTFYPKLALPWRVQIILTVCDSVNVPFL